MGAPCKYPIGTPYGRKGRHWAAGYHTGVDFLAPSGTTLVASVPGTVVHVGWGGWGQAYGINVIVEITSGALKGRRYLNAHLRSTAVKRGQKVSYGQALGKSGATGNVTGPHDHFEVRVPDKNGNYGYWQHVNPASVLAWKPTPVFIYPKKPRTGQMWLKVGSQNCAFNNKHGIATADERYAGLVKQLVGCDLLATQELPAKYRDKVDRSLKSHKMKRMAGNYGRYIYGDIQSVDPIDGRSVTPSTKAGKDEKPYSILNCKVRGEELVFVDVHLKSGDAWVSHRRKWLREVIPEVLAYAKRRGVPRHRIIWAGDWNGHREIIEEMANFGFYATFKMAKAALDEEYRTTNQVETRNGWAKTNKHGLPIDMIFTTASRPVSMHNNKRHGYSDHGSIRANVTFANK